jgi:hypothetical protein
MAVLVVAERHRRRTFESAIQVTTSFMDQRRKGSEDVEGHGDAMVITMVVERAISK